MALNVFTRASTERLGLASFCEAAPGRAAAFPSMATNPLARPVEDGVEGTVRDHGTVRMNGLDRVFSDRFPCRKQVQHDQLERPPFQLAFNPLAVVVSTRSRAHEAHCSAIYLVTQGIWCYMVSDAGLGSCKHP